MPSRGVSLSVCPSLCAVSDTIVHCVEMIEHILKLFSATLFYFYNIKPYVNIPTVTP